MSNKDELLVNIQNIITLAAQDINYPDKVSMPNDVYAEKILYLIQSECVKARLEELELIEYKRFGNPMDFSFTDHVADRKKLLRGKE